MKSVVNYLIFTILQLSYNWPYYPPSTFPIESETNQGTSNKKNHRMNSREMLKTVLQNSPINLPLLN